MKNTEIQNQKDAEILAYLSEIRALYAPQFPEIRELGPMIGFMVGKVGLYGYTDENHNSASAYALTFSEAAIELRKKLGAVPTPASKAAAKRAFAAALIAEAVVLEKVSAI